MTQMSLVFYIFAKCCPQDLRFVQSCLARLAPKSILQLHFSHVHQMSRFPYSWRLPQGYVTEPPYPPIVEVPPPEFPPGWIYLPINPAHVAALPVTPISFQPGPPVHGPLSGSPLPAPGPASFPPAGLSPIPPGLYAGGRLSGIRPGTNYLFPQRVTSIHIISDGKTPYDDSDTKFDFHIFTTSCRTTIKELLHQLGVSGDSEKIGVTECLELGNGRWCKGVTIMAADDRADKTLEFFGWDETKGESRPPTWFAVHRG